MRLVKARFDGFRLLDGLEIEFSVDPDKNITVVRAANESGKTTLLTALQWALFGDEALPSGYTTFNMDVQSGTVAETIGEVIYEVQSKKGNQQYRLIRSLVDRAGAPVRAKSTAQLYEVTSRGSVEIPNVAAHLANHMPSELREVFFTDGDSALSFIQGRTNEQQKRVRKAIEQMMGLPLLEVAVEHVRKAEKDIRSKADAAAGSQELHETRVALEAIDASMPEQEAKLATTNEEIANLSDLFARADRELQEALKRGNREEIAKELKDVQEQQTACEARIKAADLAQAELLANKEFASEMMRGKLQKAGTILDDLRTKGEIPSATIPVLEDRLTHSDCICGESLDEHQPDGARRRAAIEDLIERSRETDALKSKISDLYFEGRGLFEARDPIWTDKYAAAFVARSREQSLFEKLGQTVADLDARLDKVKDDDVQTAREMRDTYLKQLGEKRDSATRLDVSLRNRRDQRADLDKKLTTLLARENKGKRFGAELLAAQDIRQIVEQTLEIMKTREVEAVSRRMNEYFIEMIGADPSTALIKHATITPDFKIAVFGRNDHVLDPSQDLNGASRRALTIAFILALTEISGVDAPNVIDTPLGMMSGFVKTEVVRVASGASSQLILLLTHDEIRGCEAILDAKAGVIVTMTNPAHYPRILKHDPGTIEAKVLLCDCDHRSSCEICERKVSSDPSTDLSEAA
jgi:DNA sulfur modification protein DndD